MEKSFSLRIVTPDRAFFSGEVESLVIDTPTGEMGILYHTLPMVTILQAGVLRIRRNGRWMEVTNSDGFVTVLREGVTVLTRSCEWPYEAHNGTKENSDRIGDSSRKAKSQYEYKMAKAQLAAQFARLKNKDGAD
ncbi:MAG: ATP synthase F1 subunit epsilon [Clostridiales bacterium]|nr:ATP synthase F1 subunit epsilon [Clostridiales bacterium]